MQSLNSVCVINGRPGLFGDGFLAVIMSHPGFESIQEDDLVDIEKAKQATCRIKRRGMAERKVTFTMEMAKTAGLLAKDGPWKTYPARQLQMRARGFCGRDLFADVLRGVKIAEELTDYSDYPGQTISGTHGTDSTSSPSNQGNAASDPVITQDQARDFGKAWKASGYEIAEAKKWLSEAIGVDSSLKIPTSRYPEAMKWATTAKSTPAASAGPAAAAPTQQQEASPEEKNCREAFGLLDWNLAEQAAAIERHGSNWTALQAELNKALNERDGQ
jgi:hypothetical protein